MPLDVSPLLEPDAPGVVDEPELGGVLVDAPFDELPLPGVDFMLELPDELEEGAVVEEEPEPPAGGVAVELRGVVPELLPEPLEPLLSHPTSAKVARTAPARSVRLSIEILLPQYSKRDGRRGLWDAVIRCRERRCAGGIPWHCLDKRDGFLTLA